MSKPLLFILLSLLPWVAHGEIFKCADASGALTFRDSPCVGTPRQKIIEPEKRSYIEGADPSAMNSKARIYREQLQEEGAALRAEHARMLEQKREQQRGRQEREQQEANARAMEKQRQDAQCLQARQALLAPDEVSADGPLTLSEAKAWERVKKELAENKIQEYCYPDN